MTNPQAVPYAQSHSDEFPAAQAEKIAAIDKGVKTKFELGGTLAEPLAELHVESYESEWARFKAA